MGDETQERTSGANVNRRSNAGMVEEPGRRLDSRIGDGARRATAGRGFGLETKRVGFKEVSRDQRVGLSLGMVEPVRGDAEGRLCEPRNQKTESEARNQKTERGGGEGKGSFALARDRYVTRQVDTPVNSLPPTGVRHLKNQQSNSQIRRVKNGSASVRNEDTDLDDEAPIRAQSALPTNCAVVGKVADARRSATYEARNSGNDATDRGSVNDVAPLTKTKSKVVRSASS